MPLSRFISLILGLLGAVGVLAGLAVAATWSSGVFSPWYLPAITAVIVGLGVGAVHHTLAGHYESELTRLTTYIESMAKPDAPVRTIQIRWGLQPLAAAVFNIVGNLRRRVDQLTAQRRELEVQTRIAEAERAHVEAVLNSIADGVVVTDAFNEVVLANEAAASVLAFDLNHSARQPIDRVIADPVLVKLIKDTREGGTPALRKHLEHAMGRDGRRATFDVTLACVSESPSHAGSPQTAGVVTILRDITREKEIAEMKSDFVSAVSHELRTPLSSIKAYMEMLVDGEAQDEDTRLDFYNIIQSEANRLSRLIDNILNINRIESGVVKVQREHVSLPALIKEALDVMQPQARAKQITLSEVPTPIFFQVFADRDMIYQVLLNLIGNAIKYTPEHGTVTISVSVDEHDRMVEVSVSDTGVGISPDHLPHLFTKFYRIAEHKHMAKGTGLGLNLVKHIVETVHGGRVRVSSKVNEGSRFTFSLPMADSK